MPQPPTIMLHFYDGWPVLSHFNPWSYIAYSCSEAHAVRNSFWWLACTVVVIFKTVITVKDDIVIMITVVMIMTHVFCYLSTGRSRWCWAAWISRRTWFSRSTRLARTKGWTGFYGLWRRGSQSTFGYISHFSLFHRTLKVLLLVVNLWKVLVLVLKDWVLDTWSVLDDQRQNENNWNDTVVDWAYSLADSLNPEYHVPSPKFSKKICPLLMLLLKPLKPVISRLLSNLFTGLKSTDALNTSYFRLVTKLYAHPLNSPA